jgi:hypothetical protein
VDLERTFSQITGFDHVKISDLAIAVFKRRTDFRTLFIRLRLPAWNPAGFYSQRHYRGIVCLIDEVLPEEWQAQRIVIHEVVHSLQFQCRPTFRDDWLLEGLAEYCTLAILSEPYQENPQATAHLLIQNRCHLSFRDILKLSNCHLGPGFAKTADVDGLCLVTTYYVQTCLMVMQLINEIPDGPAKFAALLADLHRKKSFLDSLKTNYGMTLDEWEQSWHSWIVKAEKMPRKDFAAQETITALKELVQDEAQPPGERASYLRYYARFAGDSSLTLLRQYADSDSPLAFAARYSLFFLGEKIRKAHEENDNFPAAASEEERRKQCR